ncbi:DUF6934 family protein [Deminuibacter soli]|uniref:Uncharacterized protein n=1 Tax=Deminuibacter soli TaxID=2291815 RepID=A0A3E1NE69_9BACT|nr:hypothetical protein [Deminuibacter soli]RFM26265.1 hypothetical protein DXN05_20355 [Deminuibacter soli]
MINIDLNNTYRLISGTIGDRISLGEFYALQMSGNEVLLRVIIKPHPDPLLPNVYNLSMGPPVSTDRIDDTVRLRHKDSSLVFSTAILFALTFLTEFPDMHIGFDGSDDTRATLYHSMFITNRTTMQDFFVSIGVDWYVKLLRNQLDIERSAEGIPLFKPRPEAFDYQRIRHDLYRYYMLALKN